MKKIFKFIIILVIIATIVTVGGLIFTNTFFKLDIPDIKTENLEFGKVVKNENITDSYEIYTQKIESEDFINLIVNLLIRKIYQKY